LITTLKNSLKNSRNNSPKNSKDYSSVAFQKRSITVDPVRKNNIHTAMGIVYKYSKRHSIFKTPRDQSESSREKEIKRTEKKSSKEKFRTFLPVRLSTLPNTSEQIRKV
jgi:hypothetical protein